MGVFLSMPHSPLTIIELCVPRVLEIRLQITDGMQINIYLGELASSFDELGNGVKLHVIIIANRARSSLPTLYNISQSLSISKYSELIIGAAYGDCIIDEVSAWFESLRESSSRRSGGVVGLRYSTDSRAKLCRL